MHLQRSFLFGAMLLLVASCASPQSSSSTAESAPSTTSSPIAQSSANASQSGTLPGTLSGNFVSGEHATAGTVRLVSQNGQTSIELDQTFQTSEMGPDLVVALHRSPDVIGSTEPPAYSLKEGDYVVVAPLQSFNGAQSYTVPEGVNLADYQSVVIWCRRFNATFGSATLQ